MFWTSKDQVLTLTFVYTLTLKLGWGRVCDTSSKDSAYAYDVSLNYLEWIKHYGQVKRKFTDIYADYTIKCLPFSRRTKNIWRKSLDLTELLCQLLPVLAVTGSLLVVEARVLSLDGCQTQLNGLIKELTKWLEPVEKQRVWLQPWNHHCMFIVNKLKSLFKQFLHLIQASPKILLGYTWSYSMMIV